jgi:hypothetical protein
MLLLLLFMRRKKKLVAIAQTLFIRYRLKMGGSEHICIVPEANREYYSVQYYLQSQGSNIRILIILYSNYLNVDILS